VKTTGRGLHDQLLIRHGFKKGIIDPRYDKVITEAVEKVKVAFDRELVDEEGIVNTTYLLSKARRLGLRYGSSYTDPSKPKLILVSDKS